MVHLLYSDLCDLVGSKYAAVIAHSIDRLRIIENACPILIEEVVLLRRFRIEF